MSSPCNSCGSFTAESPRFSCALGGALPTIGAIHRAIPLLHSGPGCGMQLFNGQNYVAGYQGYGYAGGAAAPSTNTYEKEIVFGGEDRLRQVLGTTLDVMDGDLYVVLTGCTVDIIGDDVAAVLGEFQDRGAALAFAETGGFKGNTYHGYETALEAIATQIVEPLPRNRKLVNLFGQIPSQDLFWQGTLEEIARLLESVGLKVNTFFTRREGLEALKSSSSAALNILLSPYVGENLEKVYLEKFGVPSLRYPGVPVGPTATTDFLRRVAKALKLRGNRLESLIQSETAYAYDYLDKSSLVITGYSFQQRFAIVGDTNTVLSLTRFLVNDLGQLPALAVITDNPPEEKREAIRHELIHLEYGDPPPLLFAPDQWSIQEAVTKAAPTYILGSSLDKDVAQTLGVPHLSVSFPVTDRLILNKSYAGFRGAIQLIEDYVAPALTSL